MPPRQHGNEYDYRPSAVLWLFLVPAIGGFLFGYDIGGTSFVVVRLESLSPLLSSLSLQDSPLKTGWIVSSSSAGALLGTAFLAYIDGGQDRDRDRHNNANANANANANGTPVGCYRKLRSFLARNLLVPIGRRTELRYAGILYAIGGLLQFLAARCSGSNTTTSSVVGSVWPFLLLSLGRWIYGAGIGFAVHGGATYLAETTPPSVRGSVLGGKEIAIVLGILMGYVAGQKWTSTSTSISTSTSTSALDGHTIVHDEHDRWGCVYAATLVASIAMVGLSYTIPESARYLVSYHQRQRQNNGSGSTASLGRGDGNNSNSNSNSNVNNNDSNSIGSGNDSVDVGIGIVTLNNTAKNEIVTRMVSAQVLESLKFVWKPEAVLDEHRKLMEIYHKQQQQQLQHRGSSAREKHNETKTPSLLSLLSDPCVRPALRAGLGLVVLQQITGQPSVVSYAAPILARVPGLTANASVLLALFKVVATSVSVVLVETRGRKTLLTIGCSLMLVSLLVLTFAFSPPSSETTTTAAAAAATDVVGIDTRSVLALLGMFAYIAGYQIGFGPITWLMISEVFPQSVRGKAVALAVQTNFALNALVQFLVPVLRGTIGMSKTFAVFGAVSAYSIHFVRNSVPETKGLTLEEIEERLATLVNAAAAAAPAATTTTTTKRHREESLQLSRQNWHYRNKEDYGSGDALEALVEDIVENEERTRFLPAGVGFSV